MSGGRWGAAGALLLLVLVVLWSGHREHADRTGPAGAAPAVVLASPQAEPADAPPTATPAPAPSPASPAGWRVCDAPPPFVELQTYDLPVSPLPGGREVPSLTTEVLRACCTDAELAAYRDVHAACRAYLDEVNARLQRGRVRLGADAVRQMDGVLQHCEAFDMLRRVAEGKAREALPPGERTPMMRLALHARDGNWDAWRAALQMPDLQVFADPRVRTYGDSPELLALALGNNAPDDILQMTLQRRDRSVPAHRLAVLALRKGRLDTYERLRDEHGADPSLMSWSGRPYWTLALSTPEPGRVLEALRLDGIDLGATWVEDGVMMSGLTYYTARRAQFDKPVDPGVEAALTRFARFGAQPVVTFPADIDTMPTAANPEGCIAP